MRPWKNFIDLILFPNKQIYILEEDVEKSSEDETENGPQVEEQEQINLMRQTGK